MVTTLRSQILVVVLQIGLGDDAVAGVVEDVQGTIDIIDEERHRAVA